MTLSPSRTHWGYEVTNAYLRGDDTAALNACDRAGDVIRTLQAWRAAALHNLRRQREAEAAAQRFCEMVSANWFGQEPPTAEAMTRWLLHLYPICQQEDWERLRVGVAGAGLPTAGTATATGITRRSSGRVRRMLPAGADQGRSFWFRVSGPL